MLNEPNWSTATTPNSGAWLSPAVIAAGPSSSTGIGKSRDMWSVARNAVVPPMPLPLGPCSDRLPRELARPAVRASCRSGAMPDIARRRASSRPIAAASRADDLRAPRRRRATAGGRLVGVSRSDGRRVGPALPRVLLARRGWPRLRKRMLAQPLARGAGPPNHARKLLKNGAGCVDRTHDLPLTRRLLYR